MQNDNQGGCWLNQVHCEKWLWKRWIKYPAHQPAYILSTHPPHSTIDTGSSAVTWDFLEQFQLDAFHEAKNDSR